MSDQRLVCVPEHELRALVEVASEALNQVSDRMTEAHLMMALSPAWAARMDPNPLRKHLTPEKST